MTKKFYLFLIFTSLVISSFSQRNQANHGSTQIYQSSNVPFDGEKCASSYLDDELLRTDSSYAQLRQQIEIQTQNYIANQSVSRGAAGIVYTIPIVFHVMHSGEAVGDSTNIPYAQALSCIAALNRDFRRTAADGGIANSGPLGVDAEIEFCIAQRDPLGNYTTGVTRHDMSGNQGYLDSGVYHNASLWRHDASMKAMVQWDPSKYLNVWVVNKIRTTTNIYAGGGGGVIGYATFPGSSPARDGVVIRFSATGNDPTGSLGYNLWSATDDGRVLTHEVGHYLNLYHTFQSTSSCGGPSGINCSTIGDRCCDTPPTTVGTGRYCDSNYCPLDNQENYMQYQNGRCASDFTPDQVARMRAVLANTASWGRNDLVTNNNCTAPSSFDLKLDTILVPVDTICSNSFDAEVVVCNESVIDSVASFDLKYRLNAGPIQNFTWMGNLKAGDCDTLTLPSVLVPAGTHNFYAWIDSTTINTSLVDIDPSNNFDTSSFFTRGAVPITNQSVTACDSFMNPSGVTFKADGNYSDTLINQFGCDSIITTQVTINYSDSSTLNYYLCDSLISPSGKIWRTSGTYYDTIPTSNGCDSLITVNLAIGNYAIIFNPIVQACDSFQYNSVWYYSSQSFRDTVISSTACDTILVDSITVGQTSSSITTITVCDSLLTGSGKVFKNSGFYRDTMPNASGCDSLVEYYLTVNYSAHLNQLEITCDTFISPSGKTYTTTGAYKDTLLTSLGCDSIISTYLVVDSAVFVTQNTSICHDDSVVLSNGTPIKTAGTYFDTVSGTNNIIIYSENFEGATHSYTLNTNDTNAITPGANDNAWIVNNSYNGGNVFGSPIVATPNQDAAVTGNVRSNYLHIHSRYAAAWSFPSVTNANYIDPSLSALGGTNGLNFSRMTNDISTLGKSYVEFELYYLCRGSYGRLYYSTNSGASWTRFGGQLNNNGTSWTKTSFVEPAFANQANIRFAVGFDNRDNAPGSTPGFAVDEIVVRGIGSSTRNCDSITQINLTVIQPYSDSTTDTVCDMTTWRGMNLTSSGVYRDTATVGCDSIFVLNLTVDTSARLIIDTVLCSEDSLVLASGQVAKVTGTYIDTFPSALCDSFVQYNVTVILSSYTVSVSACDSFQLQSGQFVYTSGTYRDTLTSSAGCDSIVITNLTISSGTSSSISPSICGTYTSPSGKSFTTSGTYNDTIPNSIGCDSVITINLTITSDTTITVSANDCDSYTLPGGGTATATGTYRDTLTGSNGCDSIIVTNLVLGQSYSNTQTLTICQGETVTVGGSVYGTTGSYQDTFMTALGCDSIIITNLTVNPSTPSSITYSTDMCQDASPVTFTSTPVGGTWSGTGINASSGVFDPGVSGAGTFTIYYKGPDPCSETDSVEIVVSSSPTVTGVIADDECDAGVGAIDVTLGGGIAPITYSWSSGQSTEDIAMLSKGSYTISVVDANGCRDQATFTIENLSSDTCEYHVYLPNIFSPDGNGQNDILTVEGDGIETLDFKVFNRWGNLMFESTSQESGWDGTINGKQANQGVFVYQIVGTFVDGKEFEKKGTVTLIRR